MNFGKEEHLNIGCDGFSDCWDDGEDSKFHCIVDEYSTGSNSEEVNYINRVHRYTHDQLKLLIEVINYLTETFNEFINNEILKDDDFKDSIDTLKNENDDIFGTNSILFVSWIKNRILSKFNIIEEKHNKVIAYITRLVFGSQYESILVNICYYALNFPDEEDPREAYEEIFNIDTENYENLKTFIENYENMRNIISESKINWLKSYSITGMGLAVIKRDDDYLSKICNKIENSMNPEVFVNESTLKEEIENCLKEIIKFEFS